MKQTLTKKFWITMVIFSLMGQVAWVVENMYFNVFIYKMFHASASDISLMVSLSAAAATLTTWLVGAFSDKIGRRKILICLGYMVWGLSILSFALIRMDLLTPLTGSATAAASLGITLVIIMDCAMTFFGSAANDASFNAWLTDCGDQTNRGKIEGINSMMPLIAILVVFGGFMAFDLDQVSSWITIYLIIGITVIVIGILGFFLIDERANKSSEASHYWKNVFYCFRPSVMRANKLLYVVVGAFAIFGISIQIFMPYLILYYEKTLGMDNYVLIMAPAIILAAIFTAFYGKLYDRVGFKMSVVPTVGFLMAGYVLLFFGRQTAPVFIGSLLMMSGYLTGMAIFGAMIRDHIPANKAGMFQGLRIFGQVFIPGIVGPSIGAGVLRNAEVITNSDGTTSFLPNQNIYLAAFVAAAVLLVALQMIFIMVKRGHYELTSDLTMGDWKEYPRPQLRRDSYLSLNGAWKLNGSEITVPFAPQAKLSGYHKRIGAHLTYTKTFTLPEGFVKERVLLHFGAADQIAKVYVNGTKVAEHEGGYLPFTCDITENLTHVEDGVNELTVKVTDRLSRNFPYGKQCKNRGGMWYTPVSGIWQSVWLESVGAQYIEKVKTTPLEGGKVKLELMIREVAAGKAVAEDRHTEPEFIITIDLGTFTHQWISSKHAFIIDLSTLTGPDGSRYEPEYWTPDQPHLYPMTVQLVVNQNKNTAQSQNVDQSQEISILDEVTSYFALRTIEIREMDGVQRICLNGKPIFLHGVLDQGYFSDGLFLPANPMGYEQDICRMKKLGFNMLRKHIKIEPEQFYYDCDRLGMLVLQDMVNSGRYSFIRDTAIPTVASKERRDTGRFGSRKRKDFFLGHSKETIAHLYNHPCIVGYTIFNEGWGQFDSDAVGDELRLEDATRFYDYTSGWFAQNNSDVDSQHIYFENRRPEKSDRPILISECGGYSRMVQSHFYSRYHQFGYGEYDSEEKLTDAIIHMYEEMVLPAIADGVCGCVYTQVSDVEDEVNGLYTYDRQVCKVEEKKLQTLQTLGEQLKNSLM